MTRNLLAAAALASVLSLGLGAPAEARTISTQVVRGRLLPTDDASDAVGTFRILVQERGEARREFLYADAWGLDATKDGEGNLPSYHCWLVTADAATSADFGECYLTARGRARARFASAREDFPEGVATLKDFAGGTAEIRLGDAVVLTGDVPDFLGITDENRPGSHSAARVLGIKRLTPTDAGGDARGLVECLYVNRPLVTVQ